jgi:glyoxylase-like metal-dependent hydrolase (beta-lactamase superfamily II)
MKVTDLGNGIFMLVGEGGNITIAQAQDGAFMIDSQFAQIYDKVRAAIDAVTKQPVRYLINTHFHSDHTGGNERFHAAGATVVAHENVRKRLVEGSASGLTGVKTPPAPAGALPTITYSAAMTLRLKGRHAELRYPGEDAHTDGDTYVYFPDANVLVAGDIVTIARYPNIDFTVGGNIKGMIEAFDRLAKLVNDQTKVIPGHGPLAGKAQLMDYRAMLVTSHDRMAKLVAEGKSEQDVLAAKPFADLDEKWAPSERRSQNWIRVTYRSFKR